MTKGDNMPYKEIKKQNTDDFFYPPIPTPTTHLVNEVIDETEGFGEEIPCPNCGEEVLPEELFKDKDGNPVACVNCKQEYCPECHKEMSPEEFSKGLCNECSAKQEMDEPEPIEEESTEEVFPCMVKGCEEAAAYKDLNLCQRHYRKWRSMGSPVNNATGKPRYGLLRDPEIP
jgi:RecJ-like exonuclease